MLRVITPDGKPSHFTVRQISSLRLWWIFRNFSTLNDRVLSERQLELIRRICTPGTEMGSGSAKAESLVGTLELTSRSRTWEWTLGSSQQSLAAGIAPRRYRRVFIASAALGTTVLLFAGIVLFGQQARRQLTALSSKSRSTSASHRSTLLTLKQRTTNTLSQELRPVEDQASDKGRLITVAVKDSSPTFTSERVDSPAPPPVPRKPSAKSTRALQPAEVAEALPPAGAPKSRPTPEFSSVTKDAQIVLRAIISPDGSVKQVAVVEGNARLAREAMRAVSSWRYSARSVAGDAESRITFRFYAPDVVSVSFLDAHRPLQR